MHFQADEFVCERCGSLLRCTHDGPPSPFFPVRLSHLQDLEEKDLLDLFGEEDSVDIVVKYVVSIPSDYLSSQDGLN